jgi:hypothetical protein
MNWHVVGASVVGTSHQEMGTSCQDAHAYRISPTGELIVAIADGAGSAPRSAEGAALAVQSAVDSLTRACEQGTMNDAEVWQVAMQRCFNDAINALSELAEETGSPLTLFATTLTCAVLTTDMVVLGQIGDGFVVAQDEENMVFSLSQPQRGEYANEVYFLTMPQALNKVDISVHIMDMRALAMSTDGLLRLALRLPNFSPHPPFFTPLFNFVSQADDDELATRQLYEFLISPRVCARTEDDKTLVLVSRDVPPIDAELDDYLDA